MVHKPQDKKVTAAQPDQAQLREDVQKLAYELYCQWGYEHGHDLEHWAEAERRVFEQHGAQVKARG